MKAARKEDHSAVDENLRNNLIEIVRKKVFETFTRSTRLNDIQMVELENKDDFVYGHWLSFILISGSAIKIMLKMHFSTIATKKVLAKKMRKEVPAISDRVALDFLREQCNLTAGGIKATLNGQGVITGLSIPLVTRGFDEAIFSDSLDPSKIMDAWRLEWDDGSIVCSTVIEILKEQELATLKESSFGKEEEEDGEDLDGEFL